MAVKMIFLASLAGSGGCQTQGAPTYRLWTIWSRCGGWLSVMGCTRGTLLWPIMTVRDTQTHTTAFVLFSRLIKHTTTVSLPVSVYYASGCSIARFPEDGIVIAKNLKDQGSSTALTEVKQAWFASYFTRNSTVCICMGVSFFSQVLKC